MPPSTRHSIAKVRQASCRPRESSAATQRTVLSRLPNANNYHDKQTHLVAENALKQEATKPQYSLTLLNIVSSDSLPVNTRLAASLAFKNFIRSNYVVRQEPTLPP